MKLGFKFPEALFGGVLGPVYDELEQLIAAIQKGWNVEHKADGSHREITGDTLRLTAAAPWSATSLSVIDRGFIGSNTQPRCRVFHSTTQSIANATITAVSFNSEDHDTAHMHDVNTNTSRLTVPAQGAGIYLFGASVCFAANATGQRIVQWAKNGDQTAGASMAARGSAGADARSFQTTILLSLLAADYVEVQVYQDSGGALDIGHASALNVRTGAYAIKLA